MMALERMERSHGAGGRRGDPARRCLVTRESRPVESLIRFVVDPEDRLCPDIDRKLPGRGLWLTARRDILDRACAGNMFAAAAQKPVAVSEGLTDRVESLLVRRCAELIGLARRAGLAVVGFEKVRAALRAGDVSLLVSAADGSAAELRRMHGLARGVATLDALTGREIGAALGRDYIVHAGIARGRLADRLAIEGARLAGFRQPQDARELG